MNGWINRRIETAGWWQFLFWLVVNVAYSVWAFIFPGPWTRMLEAMGVSNDAPQVMGLPELTFGFVADMPIHALEKLDPVIHDYAVFQVIDIPYALTGVAMTVTGIAIGLKRFSLGQSVARYALLIPLLYLIAEVVENPLLAAMALEAAPRDGLVAATQQAATSVKFITDGASSFFLAVSIISVLIAIVTKPFRRKGKAHAPQ